MENKLTNNIKIKERQGNIEVLRILCMILIVLHHYTSHGGLANLQTLNANGIIGEFINFGGKLGAILFMMITGYFMIDSKFKIKKLLQIVLEVFFYSLGITIFLIMINEIEFSVKNIIKSMLPISYMQYWFITFYVGVYIFSPFINKFINAISKEKLKIFLIICVISYVIIPTFFISAPTFYSGFGYMVFIYIIGAYIKKYNINIEKKKCIKYILIILIFMIIVSILCTILGQKKEIFKKGIYYFHNANSITIFILAIFIFIYFKNLQIRNNKVISIFAKTSFSVYLISDHPYLRMIIWNNILKCENYYNENTVILILHILISTFIIYLICSLIDILRINILEKNIFKVKKFDKLLEKVDLKINN